MRNSFLALLLVTSLSAGAAAEHCVSYTTTEADVDVAGVLYVDNDFCGPCMWSIWVYQESNGIPGLQRGDEVHDDTCHGLIPSDTIVF